MVIKLSEKETPFKAVQPSKAELPISFILLGKDIFWRAVQFSKVELFIWEMDSGSWMSLNEEQSENAQEPIHSKLFGKLIVDSAWQQENAPWPISFKESGKETLSKEMHSKKEESSIFSTPVGIKIRLI